MGIKKIRKLTFGIMLAPIPSWNQIIENAKLVESLGFDKLWLPDHFVNPDDITMDWFECWTTLAALTDYTGDMGIGTMVSSMTLRNPALLARMALTMDHISVGRLELGIGAAGATNCHTMTGVPKWDPRERSERYQEFVEIINQMLSQELSSYHGDYFHIQEALMRPRPISKPRPLLNVAAHGPKAIRLAARFGDAWNSYNPGKGLTHKQNSDITRQRCEKLCEAAVQVGRDPNQIGRTFCFGWTSDGLFRSTESFYDAIGRYCEAGINDFCFIYVPGFEYWKDETITSRDQLEEIALDAIPSIHKITTP